MISGLVLTGWGLIFTLFIVLIFGAVAGFFIARKTMESYLKKNPPISEDMMKSMMTSMGMKPNQKQINKVMKQMKK